MGAKAKEIKLFLQSGTLDGLVNISESDGWDKGGELYSCPRSKIQDILDGDAIGKSGVYLLLSSSKVYVGQSVDLKQRIQQHNLQKDWWERAIVLTTKQDVLNQSEITYLEACLIERAKECKTLDCDNHTSGNKHNLSKYDTTILDQYLDEAYFVLELIGVRVFSKDARPTNQQTMIPPIQDLSEQDRELRAKGETKAFLESKGIVFSGPFSYAKLQDKKNVFWANPDVKFLEQEWMIVLNNQKTKTIFIMKVPARTFTCSLKGPGALIVRKDKPFYIDLNLHSEDFVDDRSHLSFARFVTDTIKY